ncbi:hypothetical protein ALNOE001_19800 [Candidatus Methanobinarius endosymbioticus]|uniref:Uncharacterized protein n=1 Tax=Candidatus Methanobinarius endosymbioticus TaxID=2006182 RepID=A0A366M7T2_9EURY|nr:hypothetical protein ALNOE001_19800 [Candidatus Methanobinarius endosymbioticus]
MMLEFPHHLKKSSKKVEYTILMKLLMQKNALLTFNVVDDNETKPVDPNETDNDDEKDPKNNENTHLAMIPMQKHQWKKQETL